MMKERKKSTFNIFEKLIAKFFDFKLNKLKINWKTLSLERKYILKIKNKNFNKIL